MKRLNFVATSWRLTVAAAAAALVVASVSADQLIYNEYQNDINYGFSYNVRDDYSGADFGHTESRHADSTEGEYFVLLPDGRVQTVKYNVDPHGGYVAEVNYKGESGHASFKTPTTKHAHRPRPPPRKPAYTLQPLYTPVIHQPLELPLVTRGYSHKPSHPQPYHTPQPPLRLDFHSTQTPSYHQHPLPPYAPPPPPPPPSPAPYHAPFAPPPQAPPYHAPYSSAPTAYPGYPFAHPRPHPPPAHPKSSPYNSLFTNDIREKNSRADKEDIYLKTEAELATMDFSGPFFYHYKRKNKHGNLGKQKKA